MRPGFSYLAPFHNRYTDCRKIDSGFDLSSLHTIYLSEFSIVIRRTRRKSKWSHSIIVYQLSRINIHTLHLPFDPRSFHHDSKKKKWKDKKKHGIVRMENLIRLLFINYQEKTSKGRLWFRSFFFPFIISTPSIYFSIDFSIVIRRRRKRKWWNCSNGKSKWSHPIIIYQEKTSKDRLDLSSFPLSFPHSSSTFPSIFPSWLEE